MRVIICLDDGLGMTFGRKRQSRDSMVLKDISESFGRIAILPFSQKLIEQAEMEFELRPDISSLEKEDTIFLESVDPACLADKIDELVIYRWNRKYLADMKCTLNMNDFKKASTDSFVGTSHDKITKEVYRK